MVLFWKLGSSSPCSLSLHVQKWQGLLQRFHLCVPWILPQSWRQNKNKGDCYVMQTNPLKLLLPASNNHSDWPSKDCAAAEIGASSKETGPLFRVWCSSALPPHVHLRPHCPLAGMHLVRHWQCGAHQLCPYRRHEDRLAGQPGRPDWQAVQ